MRIKLKSNIFGAWRGKPGDEVERPDPEAEKLIRAGYAEPVKIADKLETATLNESTEKATK